VQVRGLIANFCLHGRGCDAPSVIKIFNVKTFKLPVSPPLVDVPKVDPYITGMVGEFSASPLLTTRNSILTLSQ